MDELNGISRNSVKDFDFYVFTSLEIGGGERELCSSSCTEDLFYDVVCGFTEQYNTKYNHPGTKKLEWFLDFPLHNKFHECYLLCLSSSYWIGFSKGVLVLFK